MHRGEALDYAKSITLGDRASYNPSDRDAAYQLAHAQKLKEIAGYRNNPHLNLAEKEALDCIFTKLSRICLGVPKEDNWVDLINYPAIAIESRHVYQSPEEQKEEQQEDKSIRRMAEKLAPGTRTIVA